MLHTSGELQVSHFRAPKSLLEDAAEPTVIQVAGELHLPNAGHFQQTVQTILSSNAGRVLLDFQQVSFLDSAGLKAVLNIRKFLSLQSRPLTLRLCPDSQPDQATRNSGLSSVMTLIYEDLLDPAAAALLDKSREV